MEDVQYHLNNLFRLIKEHWNAIPAAGQENIKSAANAVQRDLNIEKEKHRQYAVMVRKMREGQRAYFKASREKNFTLTASLLPTSKANEAAVDQRTQEIINGVRQPDLFV